MTAAGVETGGLSEQELQQFREALAAGRLEEAAFQFRYAVPGPNEKDHALFKGYALLADLLMEGPAGPASMVWAEYLAALDAVPDEQAKFAREQLATAHRVFSRRR